MNILWRVCDDVKNTSVELAEQIKLQRFKDINRGCPTIHIEIRGCSQHLKGFNGAASARSRKPQIQNMPTDTQEASMGPRARARGNVSLDFLLDENVKASMGPRARARGN